MANQADLNRLWLGGMRLWWNAWAKHNQGAPVDFSNATFPAISFAGFQFPGVVYFGGATFSSEADFTGSEFSEEVQFFKAEFSSEPIFCDAIFSSDVDFTDAIFSRSADSIGLSYASLGLLIHPVNFKGAEFHSSVRFIRAKFFADINFIDVLFCSRAVFVGAKFTSEAIFDRARFIGRDSIANFNEVEFSSVAGFNGVSFFSAVSFSGGSFSHQAMFKGTCFGGLVNFENQKFKLLASFSGTHFSHAPMFHGASIHQGTDFGNIDNNFHDFESDEAEQCYRTLKLAMGKQQARPEEAAFAALELKSRRHRLKSEAKNIKAKAKAKRDEAKRMKAEARRMNAKAKKNAKMRWMKSKAKEKKAKAKKMKAEAKKMRRRWQRCLLLAERIGYYLWEKCSDSGRSFFLPLRLYLISGVTFAAFYVLLCQIWFGDWWTSLRHGFRYAFLKQFPFAAAFRGGSDRIGELEERLFGSGLPPGWVDILNAAQSITALALIFLMGLGIRHKFRLR